MRRLSSSAVLAALLGAVAHAESIAPPPAPAAPDAPVVRPPDILAVVEHNGRGYTWSDLLLVAPDGAQQPVISRMPSGSHALAVHPATGRWVMVFGQLPDGEPLVLDGKPVSKPLDRNTLVFGERGAIVGSVFGDPWCTSAVRACFEVPHGFSDDGRFAYVESLKSSSAQWSRWAFGAAPARGLIADTKVAPQLVRERDGGRAAYVRGGAVYVTTFPKQPASLKSKPTRVRAASRATVTPKLLMSAVTPIGDALYYFRREPVEQETGWVERYDLKTKKAAQVFLSPEPFPMWDSPFLSTGPRRTVLFTHHGNDNVGDLYEVGAADAAPTRVVDDLHRLLDVSADGRFVLYARFVEPARGRVSGNPLRLVIYDLEGRAEVAALPLGDDVGLVEDAHFVAPAAP
jgi:hypothetical protein